MLTTQEDVLLTHVKGVLSCLMGYSNDPLDSHLLDKFGTDPTVQVIYAVRDDAGFSLSEELPSNLNGSIVAFIKQAELDGNLHEQLLVIPFPRIHSENNRVNILNDYLRHAISPFFHLRQDKNAAVANTKKRFVELQLSLAHLQEEVVIPDISLVQNPRILAYIKSHVGKLDTVHFTDLDDASFLNELQQDVNGWIRQVQRVTCLTKDSSLTSARGEVSFWTSMETKLISIESLVSSESVQFTLECLKSAKRFHATMSFLADTGLTESMDVTQKYNQLLKDFPVNELLTASDLSNIEEALFLIFNHLNRKLRLSAYPIKRALTLVQVLSKDFNDQLVRVLSESRLMTLPYPDFEKLMESVESVFVAWDDSFKEFSSVARDLTRKRGDKFLPIRIQGHHEKLSERLSYTRIFRTQHEELMAMIQKVVKDDRLEGNALEQVLKAFTSVKSVDILDVTETGQISWNDAEAMYVNQISQVENRMIDRLRDRLAKSNTASEMFVVFAQFNALFVRPKIRGAVHEYQTLLLDRVKEDIQSLHGRFLKGHRNDESNLTVSLRDIAAVPGAIMWAQQIERTLNSLMAKVEAVLGKGWDQYAEGQKLQQEEIAFKRQLNIKPIYDQWVAETTAKNVGFHRSVFSVTKNKFEASQLILCTTFDSQMVDLFKEVRSLLWLSVPVPHTLVSLARDSRQVYPAAIALQETLSLYRKTVSILKQNAMIEPLLAILYSGVRHLLDSHLLIKWDLFLSGEPIFESYDSKRETFVGVLTRKISSFAESVRYASHIWGQIQTRLITLSKTEYQKDLFIIQIAAMQSLIEELQKQSFANVEFWVEQLNVQLGGVLKIHLTQMIQTWIGYWEGKSIDTLQISWAHDAFKVELVFIQQSICSSPPLEAAKMHWLDIFHNLLGTVTSLTRLQTRQFVVGPTTEKSNFSYVLSELTDTLLYQGYEALFERYNEAKEYVSEWATNESLWNLQESQVFAHLKDNLSKWHEVIQSVKQDRNAFDNLHAQKEFSGITVQYSSLQFRMISQYDHWHRVLSDQYSILLERAGKNFCLHVRQATLDLEKSALSSNIEQLLEFVTLVSNHRRDLVRHDETFGMLNQGQRLLEKQRFAFPDQWVFIDQIQGDYGAFVEIVTKRGKVFDDQFGSIKKRLLAESDLLSDQMKSCSSEWHEQKPLSGKLSAVEALQLLLRFEVRFTSLRSSLDSLISGTQCLGISLSSKRDPLEVCSEELLDLKMVWESLSSISTDLIAIKEVSWFSESLYKVKGRLDNLMNEVHQLPDRIRHFNAVQDTLQTVQDTRSKLNRVWILTGETLRERHWAKILKLFSSSTVSKFSITIGFFLDSEVLENNFKPVEDVVHIAQGEFVIESFLKQVADHWETKGFDYVTYKSKCKLVKGWDDHILKLQEDLTAYQSMKHSAYFKTFEGEANVLQIKLERLASLFEKWVGVQRQWVYLEGIFTDSVDVRHLLPLETSRFVSVDTEFTTLLRRLYKCSCIFDALSIPNIERSMERLGSTLNLIRKALSDYLEKERSLFPRFYFLGDEELLQMLGSSRDISVIESNVRQLFPGIVAFECNQEAMSINGIVGVGDEIVALTSPVIITQESLLRNWLGDLQSSIIDTLFGSLKRVVEAEIVFKLSNCSLHELFEMMDTFPSQILLLGIQAHLTTMIEGALAGNNSKDLEKVQAQVSSSLTLMTNAIADPGLTPLQRLKCEQLITQLVYERDLVRQLIKDKVQNKDHYLWSTQLRYYLQADQDDPLIAFQVQMADASFYYGFEYAGIQEILVHTPLTNRCYLTLTQALHHRMGGRPSGPAGTGKTETVKSLGAKLGRLVLVFCCDETFNYQSTARIFSGICSLGAWGCFDEFNRLDPKMLSAVSQQVVTIQSGLSTNSEVKLLENCLAIHPDTGIFITMNPGYSGRSALPENLKRLFRSVIMNRPDLLKIGQVMLFSQGFHHAESLSGQVIKFFELCQSKLSKQQHYDFGLRAMKVVLQRAGKLFRSGDEEHSIEKEAHILLSSVIDTVFPKLVSSDYSIINETFASQSVADGDDDTLIHQVIDTFNLIPSTLFIEKTRQLHNMLKVHHGIMMVGPSSSGKSVARKVVTETLARENHPCVVYNLDPKVIGKSSLYGSMDPATREWTDGVFTSILRRVIEDPREFVHHWIVFDTDLDPEWVENLNSVLDDNKLLTLPTGERIRMPPNLWILFEVEDVHQATPATVSRCGMVWFPSETVSPEIIVQGFAKRLMSMPLDLALVTSELEAQSDSRFDDDEFAHAGIDPVQLALADVLNDELIGTGLFDQVLAFTSESMPIMKENVKRATVTLLLLLTSFARDIVSYNEQHDEFPIQSSVIASSFKKQLLIALVWSFGGECSSSQKTELASLLMKRSDVSPLDSFVELPSGKVSPWKKQVVTIDLDSSTQSQDVIIPTVDTVRLDFILKACLGERRLIILCGAPGAGKTMCLMSCLRKMPLVDVVSLNFSSGTNQKSILRLLETHCSISANILAPSDPSNWLVVFCDEINLPRPDKYGTQNANSFIRFLIQYGGFWNDRCQWIRIERIQFVGACNPPTDVGRVHLSQRLLRLSTVLYIDYPTDESLETIYSTFLKSVLKRQPSLRSFTTPLTRAMVQVYSLVKTEFSGKDHNLYTFSPRELSRWVRGLTSYLLVEDNVSPALLISLWAHEAARLFKDRLALESEQLFVKDLLARVVSECFPTLSKSILESTPYFCNLLSTSLAPVSINDLNAFMQARAKIFSEEGNEAELFMFPQAIDHVLRISRILSQERGHGLIIGESGVGKASLTRFAAWINGASVVSLCFHKNYHLGDFDIDLRKLLKSAGLSGEKLVFLLEESSISDSAFLERMNSLLTDGEVAELFEPEEQVAHLNACKEVAGREGVSLETTNDVLNWFTSRVRRNLHVVFTMDANRDGIQSRCLASPALLNRCTLDWFGDWSLDSFQFVANKSIRQYQIDLLPLKMTSSLVPMIVDQTLSDGMDIIVDALLFIHQSAKDAGSILNHSPRHFLDLLKEFTGLYCKQRDEMEKRHEHIKKGLEKLKDTFYHVEELKSSLTVKKQALLQKESLANAKLRTILDRQQESEKQKADSITLQTALIHQNDEIQSRQLIVETDLAQAEPALVEAKESVSHIKRQHLTEVRAMNNPPDAVKQTMEAVCILLGFIVDSWKSVQAILRRDDFISSIVNYDTSRLTKKAREIVRSTYLDDTNITFEAVNRASKACGPLMLWINAQVNYAEILQRVQPLRAEVETLKATAVETSAKAESVQQLLIELDETICVYKEDYAKFITETEALKRDMDVVESKVKRSIQLIDNLAAERTRWERLHDTFGDQREKILGDTILASAFLNYCGAYSQSARSRLQNQWKDRLRDSGISFNELLTMPEYLTSREEQHSWDDCGLPADQLCHENATIMAAASRRIPLIIDPAGQCVPYLTRKLKNDNFSLTNFRDGSFIKLLETAMRFGQTIIIENAEDYDPILAPVLAKRIFYAGGRRFCYVGQKDVDYSESFRLILTTRNACHLFSPVMYSNTNMVNFTVTPDSLTSQCLDLILKAEHPEISIKRQQLIKLQGEYQLQLYQLEQQLLETLSESTGDILENDTLVVSLEVLKSEASKIQQQVNETDIIVEEVDKALAVHAPLAESCSQVYFVIEDLSKINRLYHLPLDFFMEIFIGIVSKRADAERSSDGILADFLMECYARCSYSLLSVDALALGLRLTLLKLDDRLPSKERVLLTETVPKTLEDARSYLSTIPIFKSLAAEKSNSEWDAFFMQHSLNGLIPPSCFEVSEDEDLNAFRRLLLVKFLKPDLLVEATEIFIEEVFGSNVISECSIRDRLQETINANSTNLPILILEAASEDNGYRVEGLASTAGRDCFTISLGSKESLAMADQAIHRASCTGNWVLIKNVHLDIEWFLKLNREKSSTLFLTMDMTAINIPISLLSSSRLVLYEPATGIKSTLTSLFDSVPVKFFNAVPEQSRIMFNLAWLHSIIMDRLRYGQMGWTKDYEFGEPDFAFSLAIVSSLLKNARRGRTNIPIEQIPFQMIQELVISCVYGGKVETNQDEALLSEFVNVFISSSMFQPRATLKMSDLIVPDVFQPSQLHEWIKSLPSNYPSTWIGLSLNANEILQQNKGNIKSL